VRGAIRAALNFFALLFSFKRKKEKTYNRRIDEKSRSYNEMPHQVRHDSNKRKMVNRFNAIEVIWAFEKV